MSVAATCDGCGKVINSESDDHIEVQPVFPNPRMMDDITTKHFDRWQCLENYARLQYFAGKDDRD